MLCIAQYNFSVTILQLSGVTPYLRRNDHAGAEMDRAALHRGTSSTGDHPVPGIAAISGPHSSAKFKNVFRAEQLAPNMVLTWDRGSALRDFLSNKILYYKNCVTRLYATISDR